MRSFREKRTENLQAAVYTSKQNAVHISTAIIVHRYCMSWGWTWADPLSQLQQYNTGKNGQELMKRQASKVL